MIHARSDYQRIQDPDHKIPADEPVFLIRGQDQSGPETIRYWALLNDQNSGDAELSTLARLWALKMEAWQVVNGAKPADL